MDASTPDAAPHQRPLVPGGPDVSVHGQGTWEIEAAPRDEAVAALRRGFELGLTHVDTAEMYGDGASEEVVGAALEGWRDPVFVASKVLPHNASRAGVRRSCEASLRRLGRERLDLYLLHWPGAHPLEETLAGFEDLVEAGLIARYGVSNFDGAALEAAVQLAGPGRIACNQVLYHLEERAVEHRVLPTCRRLEVALVAYSPFGSGAFPGPETDGGRVLGDEAERLGCTPRQLALAFLARDPAVWTIPKAARRAHVEENAGALGRSLDATALAALEQAFPRGPEPAHLPVI